MSTVDLKLAITASAARATADYPANTDDRVRFFIAFLAGWVKTDEPELGQTIFALLGNGGIDG